MPFILFGHARPDLGGSVDGSARIHALAIPDDPARVNKAANEGRLLQELAGRAKITRRFADLAAALNGTSSVKPS